MAVPTLVLLTGPGGSGKTTLAELLSRRIGCPLISRDAIKEGMVATTPGFVPGPSDPLTVRTYGVFFEVIELLLRAGVTVVAEAAFQHGLWVGPLDRLRPLAEFRVLRCRVADEVRRRRADDRTRRVATRAAHDDSGYFASAAFDRSDFDAIRVDAPTLDVDSTAGYRPDLAAIVEFVTGAGEGAAPRVAPRSWGRKEQ